MMCNRMFPEEIVVEILLKLPSKSVIRLKSACKHWLAMFSSSRFMAKHLLPKREHDDDLLLFKRRDKTNQECVLSLLSNDTLNVDHSRSLFLPHYPDVPITEILSSCSCNGLICLSYRTPFLVLWRPATGDVKVVPTSDPQPPPGATFSYRHDYYSPDIGFGYDSNSQDYKIIRLHYKVAVDPITGSTIRDDGINFEMYSFNSDTWRSIECDLAANIIPCDHRSRTFANGVFTWWACHTRDQFDSVVLFRLSDHSFGITLLPPTRFDARVDQNGTVTQENFVNNFLVLNDRLALVMLDYGMKKLVERRFHVWVMLEFGVEDSWTRVFVIPPLFQIERILWFWNNGKMIMENNDGDLVLYDPFDQEMKPLNIGGLCNNVLDAQIISIPAKHVFQPI